MNLSMVTTILAVVTSAILAGAAAVRGAIVGLPSADSVYSPGWLLIGAIVIAILSVIKNVIENDYWRKRLNARILHLEQVLAEQKNEIELQRALKHDTNGWLNVTMLTLQTYRDQYGKHPNDNLDLEQVARAVNASYDRHLANLRAATSIPKKEPPP